MPTPSTDLCDLTARELVALLHDRRVSAREVMTAHLARIDQVNTAVNAIVTLVPDAALDAADAVDAALARGDDVGPLHGLPVAHKDLFVTAGIRTTFGSLAFKDYVPDETALIVERARRAGAITIGKTNTPEFGAGSQTFNQIFGTTCNPYDPTKTCGGSSGGAAAALATGMVPIADGSDLGGSLRNPASFCNVVGLRPSPGRVPRWPTPAPWFAFNVHGPMARTVGDVALLLDAIAGPDARAPLSRTLPARGVSDALDRDVRGVRVAWSRDLGGLPVEPAVTSVLDRQRATFEALGCITDEAHPDLADADTIFTTWWAWYYD
ncbi:MAG TPA: amidase, partial [Acidobacteria bacterium]|nr:amidase [Acidobacteriota bacterium]